ncbi:hypothetical protein GTO27_10255 [Candidatus Bathyarchaeota archaeon]|nr:hypothetical protein [Candidatus Bathyarchaeota archaeon]
MVDSRTLYHAITDFLLTPFEKVDVSPNAVSWFSLLMSISVYLFFSLNLVTYGILSLFFVLFLDALDGFLARKTHLLSFDGLVVDASCDRLSEFLIFYPSLLWLALTAVNCYVTFWRLKNERILILPLRHLFLLITVLGFFRLI